MKLADKILQADDLQTETVRIDEWDATVHVRELTAAERDAYEQSIVAREGEPMNLRNIRARLVALTLVDDKGERIFTDEQAEALGRKSGRVLDRLFDVAQRLNKMRKQDVEDVKGN